MPDEKRGGAARPAAMLRVLKSINNSNHRHAPSFIRHILDAFRQHTLSAGQARRATRHLAQAAFTRCPPAYTPRGPPATRSGRPALPVAIMPPVWPQPVLDLLQKRLACSPPCPYSFAASEALRLHAFNSTRPGPPLGARKPTSPFAVPPKKSGAVRLATPLKSANSGSSTPRAPLVSSLPDRFMLNLLGWIAAACFTGSKLYGELLPLLLRLPARRVPGPRPPLQIYVDLPQHLFHQRPGRPDPLGWALKFYDISSSSPPRRQARGKIERATNTGRGACPPTLPMKNHRNRSRQPT